MKPFVQSANTWRGEVLKTLVSAQGAEPEVWRIRQCF